MSLLSIPALRSAIHHAGSFVVFGRVTKVVGILVEGDVPDARIGTMCAIEREGVGDTVWVEVVGLRGATALTMPLGDLHGVQVGDRIFPLRVTATLAAGPALLGRVIDALGRPLDGKGVIHCAEEVPLYRDVANPLARRRIRTPVDLGVRSVNGLCTVGHGQRLAILAGSGVGKSVLLSTFARNTSADVTVVGLVGERGREVKEFIDKNLGEEGLARSVVVVSTSDRSPVERMRAAFVATAVAEYFCAKGKNVLLLVDSLTRFAMAQREIGLAAGEPPTTKGYTPSVFSLLPKLLERAGNFEHAGSITGLYAVLAEADDLNDPIVDAVRAITDGHLALSRALAARNHYPAVDILNSISRSMVDIVPPAWMSLAGEMRTVLADYTEAEDLVSIGAYVRGSNPRVDRALAKIDDVRAFLRQTINERATLADTQLGLARIFGAASEVAT